MHRLIASDQLGIPEVKWCSNRFTPFIAVDPAIDDNPGDRDIEEYIEIVRLRVSEVKKIARQGRMLLPSVTTCYWAFDWLDDNFAKE